MEQTAVTTKAFAYYRTSSATNVGADKDSLARQESAVESYARANDIEIVRSFYDAAVSGADPVDTRPDFARMMEAIAGNGVRLILVETANRFARDLIVQEIGHGYLRKLGIELVAVDSPKAFLDDTPTAVLIRQILGAVSQFEKASLVAKLAAARRRTGRLGGKKRMDRAAVSRAREIMQLDGGGTLRGLAARLKAEGYVTSSGKAYGPSAIARMLDEGVQVEVASNPSRVKSRR
jgi:DNA invertase Pin-like site-specific DNA recombinase